LPKSITFIDRGRLVDSSDKEDFLDRWRRIQLQIAPGTVLPELPQVVSRVVDGQFVTLTTNQFSQDFLTYLGSSVRQVHRMTLEEIFVANVLHHREIRGQ
jgi:ABC-2 type transport system ATP-binding protein